MNPKRYLIFWAEPGKVAFFVGTFNRSGMAEWSRMKDRAALYTKDTAEQFATSLGHGAQVEEVKE